MIKKLLNCLDDIPTNRMPIGLEKYRALSIGAGALVVRHREEGSMDLRDVWLGDEQVIMVLSQRRLN